MENLGPFSVVLADPPWRLNDQLPGPGRGACKHYTTMTVDELCQMKLPPVFDNSWLFLWRLAAMVPEAYRVCEAWGFTPKTEMVWNKLTPTGKRWCGMGHYTRASHETLIVATRGTPIRVKANVLSTFEGIVGEHSEKPQILYDKIDLLAGTHTSKVELFARKQRPGWVCLGDEMPSPTVFG